MSTEEILAELPKLSLDEVTVIYQRAESLLEDQQVEENSGLLAAIEEADRTSENEDVSEEQLLQQVSQWAHSK